jgi:hypothetical protein
MSNVSLFMEAAQQAYGSRVTKPPKRVLAPWAGTLLFNHVFFASRMLGADEELLAAAIAAQFKQA